MGRVPWRGGPGDRILGAAPGGGGGDTAVMQLLTPISDRLSMAASDYGPEPAVALVGDGGGNSDSRGSRWRNLAPIFQIKLLTGDH